MKLKNTNYILACEKAIGRQLTAEEQILALDILADTFKRALSAVSEVVAEVQGHLKTIGLSEQSAPVFDEGCLTPPVVEFSDRVASDAEMKEAEMREQFEVIEVDETNFQKEVIESDVPVLVQFWADWCGPCKMIKPTVEKVAAAVSPLAKVRRVNVDAARDLARRFNVRSIPLLLFFRGGEVIDQLVGANFTQEVLKKKLLSLAKS